MEKPKFRQEWVENRVKPGKTVIFQGCLEKLFQVLPWKDRIPFLQVLDPNSPSFYVKCPRKYQKTYNVDIF